MAEERKTVGPVGSGGEATRRRFTEKELLDSARLTIRDIELMLADPKAVISRPKAEALRRLVEARLELGKAKQTLIELEEQKRIMLLSDARAKVGELERELEEAWKNLQDKMK